MNRPLLKEFKGKATYDFTDPPNFRAESQEKADAVF
jgi:hypothetical protein